MDRRGCRFSKGRGYGLDG